MDYGEALTQIERLENGSLLISAIKSRVEGILDEKRRAVTTSDAERDRASNLESYLGQLTKVLNAEGDTPEAKTKSIIAKATNLISENAANQKTISTLEAAKGTAETLVAQTEEQLKLVNRNLEITEAAQISKANPNVLKKLITEDIKLEISQTEDNNQQVLVVKDDTRVGLSEYAQSNWADFVPSLFPGVAAPSKPPVILPSGSPNGKAEKQNPVNDYIVGAGFGLKK